MRSKIIQFSVFLSALISVQAFGSCPSANHTNGLADFALSQDGSKVAAAALDGSVFLWDVRTRKQAPLANCLYASSLAFSSNSLRLAIGDSAGNLHVFDVSSGQLVQRLSAISPESEDPGAQVIEQIVFSGDGSRLATHDSTGASVWSVNEQKRIMFISDERRIEKLALNRDGTMLARGGYGRIILWDVITGKQLRRIDLPVDETVEALLFAHDDRWIISASLHQGIKIWETKTGNAIKSLGPGGHPRFPLVVTTSDFLVAVGNDGTFRMWNLATGQLLSSRKILPGFVDNEAKVILSSSPQPGRLELSTIARGGNEHPISFVYKSPFCLTKEGSLSRDNQLDNLQLVGMGESSAPDGTHLSFTTYLASECNTVTFTHGDFISAQNATAQLQNRAQKAARVIEQTQSKDLSGQSRGTRAVLILSEVDGVPAQSAIIWTDATQYFELTSSSLALAQSLEKRYRH